MTREEALAICSKNLKGRHKKDLLTTARALEFLVSHPQKTSTEEVGNLVGVSREIVRQFLGLLLLPEAIQRMLERNQLGLDKAHQLGRLSDRSPELQLAAAQTMVGVTAKRSRLFVSELADNPQLSLLDAVKRAEEKEAETEQTVRLEVVLPIAQHRALEMCAQQRESSVAKLAADILSRWLDSTDRETTL